MSTTLLLVLGAAALLAAGYAVLHARRTREGTYNSFHCPGCGQKVRYQAGKAGRTARCPRCKKPCQLPAESSEDQGQTPRHGGYRVERRREPGEHPQAAPQ